MTGENLQRETDAVTTLLLSMGDDEFVTGHRMSYWVSRGPSIEEDNAVSSIVQDELGHARLWFEVLTERADVSLVELAVERPAERRRNTVLAEPAYAGFGDLVVRNFLYDEAERLLVEAVHGGDDDVLADRAGVVLNEEPYHREHAALWLDRLTASDEGVSRLTRAFDTNVPHATDYFAFEESVASTLESEGVVDRAFDDLQQEWADRVVERVRTLGLELERSPRELVAAAPTTNGRLGEHTDELTAMTRQNLTVY